MRIYHESENRNGNNGLNIDLSDVNILPQHLKEDDHGQEKIQ